MPSEHEAAEEANHADERRPPALAGARLLKHRAFLTAFAVIAAAGIALLPNLSPTTRAVAYAAAAVLFGVQIARRWNG